MTSAGRHISKLLALFILMVGALSCTYDYFEDENNFRVYVPQIKDGTVNSFFIAIHESSSGKHIVSRHVEAPFDKDELLSEGILRFKLVGGREYDITCFTDYTPKSITEGYSFSESYKGKSRCATGSYSQIDYYYDSRHNDPRMMRTQVVPEPLGHPGASDPLVIDMNGENCFKGKVDIELIDLPASVASIDVIYKGLATKVMFDGNFARYHTEDRILASYDNITPYRSGNKITLPTDIINPSSGLYFDRTITGRRSLLGKTKTPYGVPAEPLELEVLFYDAGGSSVGKATFTDDYFRNILDDNKKPQDDDGNPIQSLVLYPRKRIKFTFKDFLVINIELKGWDDPDEGHVTPM